MGSPPRTPREEEQRLNLRTLVIASAASATAALVTSRLWIAGTWIAAAMTPVLVTLVSEMLRRPTERIARGVTADRAALPDPEASAARPHSPDRPFPDPDAPVRGARPAPTRIYRSEAARSAPRTRRIAYRVVFGTAALAFVIGVLALTVPELIAGGSVGKNDGRTTFFGGSKKKEKANDGAEKTTEQTTPDRTETEQEPTTTGEEPTTPETETTTTPTTPEQAPGEPLPTETNPSAPAQP